MDVTMQDLAVVGAGDGMCTSLGFANAATFFIEGLAVEEAIAVLATCQESKCAIKAHLAILAFAVTRPKLLTNGPPLTTKMWSWLWGMCAASESLSVVDPGLWVHAKRAICLNKRQENEHYVDGPEGEKVVMNFAEDEEFLVHFMEKSLQPAEFNITVVSNPEFHAPVQETKNSAILMIGAEEVDEGTHDDYEGFCVGAVIDHTQVTNALVVLADKTLAWISTFEKHYDDNAMLEWTNKGGLVCIHDELEGVLEMVKASWTACDGCLVGVHQLNLVDNVVDGSQNTDPQCVLISNDESKTTSALDGVSRLLRQSCRVGQKSHGSLSGRGAFSGPGTVKDEVIEQIEHSEPPAVLDAEMAALQVGAQTDDDFAMITQRHISEPEIPFIQPSSKVHLISFRSGKGELFRKMLLQDKEFKPLRKGLQDSGYPLVLKPPGVIVLVRPDQYLDTVASLASHRLKRYNLVVAESEEYLVDEVLQRMRSKQRPRENRSEREELKLGFKFVTHRTFICEAPRRLMAATVIQSTTEARRCNSAASSNYLAHVRGENPRRLALGTWDN